MCACELHLGHPQVSVLLALMVPSHTIVYVAVVLSPAPGLAGESEGRERVAATVNSTQCAARSTLVSLDYPEGALPVDAGEIPRLLLVRLVEGGQGVDVLRVHRVHHPRVVVGRGVVGAPLWAEGSPARVVERWRRERPADHDGDGLAVGHEAELGDEHGPASEERQRDAKVPLHHPLQPRDRVRVVGVEDGVQVVLAKGEDGDEGSARHDRLPHEALAPLEDEVDLAGRHHRRLLGAADDDDDRRAAASTEYGAEGRLVRRARAHREDVLAAERHCKVDWQRHQPPLDAGEEAAEAAALAGLRTAGDKGEGPRAVGGKRAERADRDDAVWVVAEHVLAVGRQLCRLHEQHGKVVAVGVPPGGQLAQEGRARSRRGRLIRDEYKVEVAEYERQREWIDEAEQHDEPRDGDERQQPVEGEAEDSQRLQPLLRARPARDAPEPRDVHTEAARQPRHVGAWKLGAAVDGRGSLLLGTLLRACPGPEPRRCSSEVRAGGLEAAVQG
eukprot:CAMPEP_0185522974 /NCGR_PEP_ID=MMETSP1366-20130426/84095_1 /TAXON_ID=38817 /ORGANISM="Gephyrocapsa oceanica, Strain RCC1303" /LENGTH=501 /DNA_ID=CAMNT_0028134243 /DNA_START=12 /DNA_END=1513 /DNA_ORIENTATION=+